VIEGRSTVSIGTEPLDPLSLEPPHPESASADTNTSAETTRTARSYGLELDAIS